MNDRNNNSEQLVNQLAGLFDDVDSLPDGDIKDSIINLKKMSEQIEEKKKIKTYDKEDNFYVEGD